MKIALIVPGFSAHERDWCIPALLNYVRALTSVAEVHVFALRWPERRATYRVHGALVHALDGRPHMGVRAAGLWLNALQAIRSEHRRAGFSLLHAFWADEPGWVGAWASWLLGVPLVISLAGGELSRLPDINYGHQLLPGRPLLVRHALARAACVTAGSNYMLRLAREFCEPARLARAPLGVDLNHFAPTATAAPLAGGPLLLTVGALSPVKDHALLLRVFRRVKGAVPAVRLELVGDGPERAALQAAADGLPVTFRGEVDHGALPGVYRQAAVYVQTSRHEAQGVALLEAAASGVPVLGTPVGVLPEIGLTTVGEGDLADQLVQLLGDASRRRQLGIAARERVEADFSLEQAVQRFARVYAQAAGGDARASRRAYVR